MKIYLVKRKNTNVRWFDNETDLTEFLINAPENISDYQVSTINAEVESEMNGSEIFNSLKEQNELDRKLTVALGDEYASKVQKMISLFEQLCKKQPWDKTMTLNALKVYEKLTTTSTEEKKFKKISAPNLRYLLYCVSDSVEWYKALLDVYPQIKGLAETRDIEYIDPITRGTSWRGERTPVNMIKNFEKAKALMK